MSALDVVFVVLLLVMAGAGVGVVAGLVDANTVRVAGKRTSAGQRRFALSRIRTGQVVGAGEVALVRAVAAGRARGASLVATFVSTTLSCLALTWGQGRWAVVGEVAACVNLGVAVALGVDLVRARAFLGGGGQGVR